MTTELKSGLFGALAVHALILFNLTYWFAPNRFDVQAAPSSLEVALVSVKAPPKIKIQKEMPKERIVKEEQISDQQIKKVIEEVKREPNPGERHYHQERRQRRFDGQHSDRSGRDRRSHECLRLSMKSGALRRFGSISILNSNA